MLISREARWRVLVRLTPLLSGMWSQKGRKRRWRASVRTRVHLIQSVLGRENSAGAPHSDFSETTVGSFVNLSTEKGGNLIIERFTVKRLWAYQRKKILNIATWNQLLKGMFLQIQFVTAHWHKKLSHKCLHVIVIWSSLYSSYTIFYAVHKLLGRHVHTVQFLTTFKNYGFFSCSAATQRGSWPPHFWGF